MHDGLFTFPDPVNEVSTRVTAGFVATLAAVTLALHLPWLFPVLAYGFAARVLAGPTLSPLAQLVTRVITPRLPFDRHYVSGPPKRFAQGIGAVVTLAATILYFAFDRHAVAYGLAGVMVLFAVLEAAFGLCVGCKLYGLLMRAGLFPDDACAECADISLRRR